MFRRVKKWAAKVENLLPKAKPVCVTCTIEEENGEQCIVIQKSSDTILSVVREQGLELSSYCGGMCSCGTCIVDIVGDQGCLTPMASREIAVLGYSNKESSRLACQARFVGEGKVHVKLRKPL